MRVNLVAESSDHVFERFVGEQYSALINYLRGRGVLYDDAQDIVQESLHKLTRYRDLPAEALKPLLYRIALNTLYDSRRRQSKLPHASLSDADSHASELPDEMPQPEQWAEHREELGRIRIAIEQLPDRCREIYLLNRIDGMSYSQISKHCDISVKAVEKHMGRALSSLRKLLSVPAEPADISGKSS